MKTRCVPESNYKSIWLESGKTMRFAIDPSKPITELEYPEFYDIKLTAHCGANCPQCYMDSKPSDPHYENVVEKLRELFSRTPVDQQVYQIAFGGGEPTSHPDFTEVLRMTKEEYDITPNYTTNGMWIDDLQKKENILRATKMYAGGVAISCHPHLNETWARAAKAYIASGIRLNFHNIISDRKSIDTFLEIFYKWKEFIEYFVLLPYGNIGRAEPKDIDWDYFISVFPKENKEQIAFGANFYPYLLRGELDVNVSLYEPEIMSKFISLEGNGSLYKSSFSSEILKDNLFKK